MPNPDSEAKARVEADRESTRLWRVFKTVKEMVHDRGYVLAEHELHVTLDDFKADYTDSMGYPDRKKMAFHAAPSQEMLARYAVPPTPANPNPPPSIGNIWVEFNGETSVGIKQLKAFAHTCDQEKMSGGIFVTAASISPAALKVIPGALPIIIEHFLEQDLLVNITHHELVPKHVLLSREDKQRLLERYRLKESQLPRIQVSDPVAKYLGLRRGQVVKIIRKIPSRGKTTDGILRRNEAQFPLPQHLVCLLLSNARSTSSSNAENPLKKSQGGLDLQDCEATDSKCLPSSQRWTTALSATGTLPTEKHSTLITNILPSTYGVVAATDISRSSCLELSIGPLPMLVGDANSPTETLMSALTRSLKIIGYVYTTGVIYANNFFGNANSLRAHRQVHLPRTVECYGCTRTFITTSAMLIHLESGNCTSNTRKQTINRLVSLSPVYNQVMDSQNYDYDYFCDKMDADSNWNLHAQLCPYQEEYLCPEYECDKGFRMVSGLAQHLESAAHDVLPYKCPECKALLSTLSGMVQHAESERCDERIDCGDIWVLLRYLKRKI